MYLFICRNFKTRITGLRCPKGLLIETFQWELIIIFLFFRTTNSDGRAILGFVDDLDLGVYKLIFHIKAYFQLNDVPSFFPVVEVGVFYFFIKANINFRN